MSRFDRSEDMYQPSTYQLKAKISELEERVENLEAVFRNQNAFHAFSEMQLNNQREGE